MLHAELQLSPAPEEAVAARIAEIRAWRTANQPGEPSERLMSADTMKIPDPTMEPATSIVASVRVIAFTNWPFSAVGWLMVVG